MTEYDVKARLPILGWAGELTLEEALFIQDALKRDARLRQQWGFKKAVPLTKIAERAFPENPDYARKHIESEMAKRGRGCHPKIAPDAKKSNFYARTKRV